jgi:hypothetical protein
LKKNSINGISSLAAMVALLFLYDVDNTKWFFIMRTYSRMELPCDDVRVAVSSEHA